MATLGDIKAYLQDNGCEAFLGPNGKYAERFKPWSVISIEDTDKVALRSPDVAKAFAGASFPPGLIAATTLVNEETGDLGIIVRDGRAGQFKDAAAKVYDCRIPKNTYPRAEAEAYAQKWSALQIAYIINPRFR